MNYALAALEHLRLMEVRIEQQTDLIARLKESGEDTREAAKKLILLRRTFDEMRVQMAQLLPAEARETMVAAH
jgi:hypothetical protein